MSDPYFSFIIPTCNRASTILIAIQSIIGQEFQSLEIIVIDDGSTDNTEEAIKTVMSSKVNYYKINNCERGAARNYGAQYAKGQYINFFDSDDILLPCLASLQSFITLNNEPDVVFGGIQQTDVQRQAIKTKPLPYTSFTLNLLHNNFLACGAVFLKREIVQVYSFQEDRKLSSAEDWELWLRIHTQHEFIKFPDNIFLQIHHEGRSLQTIDAKKVEERDCYFASLVVNNEVMLDKYGKPAINLLVADRYTFIALAYSEKGDFDKSYYYWKKAFKRSLLVVKRKRFWAVFKKFIYK